MIKFIYDTCFNCKHKKFFVKHRHVQIRKNIYAKSREKFCRKCYKDLEKQLTKSNI